MKTVTVVLYGKSGVGKTQVLNRLSDQDFVDNHTSTKTFVHREKTYPEQRLTVNYYDIGTEMDSDSQRKIFSQAQQICLVFNKQDADSFGKWDIEYIQQIAPDASITIIGTHDEEQNPAVSDEMVWNFIETNQYNIMYTMVSSRDNLGFDALKAYLFDENIKVLATPRNVRRVLEYNPKRVDDSYMPDISSDSDNEIDSPYAPRLPNSDSNLHYKEYSPQQPNPPSSNATFLLRALQFFLVLGGIMAAIALITCAPAAATIGFKAVAGVAAQDISTTAALGALASFLTSVGLYAVRRSESNSVEAPRNTMNAAAR